MRTSDCKSVAEHFIIRTCSVAVIGVGYKLTIVFIKAFKKSSHPVVPELNGAIMKGSEDPWALWMEGNAFDAIAFGLELFG